ncbi:uncharacterized protein [Diadema setosum]|uniref:uncharacterized protein n=1 Tax=Diadema setosum TaxID=31175 RepID=UPI003B3BA87C
MSDFLSIGEGFQPKSDAVTMAGDEKGTVAAFTGISESVTESGLLQDFPTVDFIVVKSESACSPEKEWNTGLGSSLRTPSSNTTPAQVLERLDSPPNSTPDDLSSKMNDFSSIGEDFQPNSDPGTVAEDETGTVAAFTGISESMSESGLPQDYPAADLIVLKSEPACSPEKDTRDSTACFDQNPHTNDVEPVSATVPPSERVREVLSQITTSSGQVKSDTAEQLCCAHQKIDVVGSWNDGRSSEHHSEVNELPSLDHDYCITSDMFKKGRSRCYRRKSPLLPRVELPDIPIDRQERIQERIQEKRKKWLPRGITGKSRVIPRVDLANRFTQPRNGNRKLIEAPTLVHKRITLAIKFDPGPDVTVRGTSVCEVKDEANEESSGLKEVEMEEKQEEKKEKEEKEKEEKEEEEEEWLESSESESEEQYDSRDPDYLPYPADRKDTVKVERPFKRKVTGKKALSRLERQRYYMIQFMILPKRFRCTICRALFSSVHGFDKHMDSNHDVQGKMFRSELLQLLEEKKTPEVLERYKEELRKRGYNPEAELKRRKCLEKPKDLSECQQSPVTTERGTMQTRASEKRTDQEGMMMMRMDEGEGDWSHLSGEGQPENINPADVGTVGTIWGKEGQRKDDGGVQNHGCCNDSESLISKNHSCDTTDLENLQELCIEEGEKKEKSISRERTVLEESLEDHCRLSHDTVIDQGKVIDQTPLSVEESTAGVVSVVVSSPAEENSSRFENQEIGGKETISVEGTDAVNIPVSNESAEMALDDISDVFTNMPEGEKNLSSELFDAHYGTTFEGWVLNMEGELDSGDNERREESPDRTLMDQEEDAEQSTDTGMHDEQEGLRTCSAACRSEHVANVESELKDEPKSFSFDQDIDIIWWMNSWSHISFECDVCKRDVSFSHMRSHMLRHEKVRHCMVCNNWFVSETQYESHLPGCEWKKPCACEYCGKSFKNLPLHISLMHSTPSKEKVQKKKENWDGHKWRKNKLKKHLRLARRYRCRICVESFLSILEFGNHMNSSHVVQGEVFRSELLQLLEEKKTPEVLERYKEELQKRGYNPEAELKRRKCLEKPKDLSECQLSPVVIERRTFMQTRASKRRTDQEGMVVKRKDEGEGDCSHLSGEGQPDNIHPAEVGTIYKEKTLSSGMIDEQFGTTCDAGLLDIGELEAGDSEGREGSPDRTLVDQEHDAEQSMDVGMHDEEKSLETGSGSKNVVSAESELKDEPKSFSPDQDIDIVYWMDGWSDIFFECNFCKTHVTLSSINRHLNMHTKVRRCKYCYHWYADYDVYRDHLAYCRAKNMDKLKPENMSYVCEICGKSFQNIARHIRHMHSQLRTSFPCKLCDQSFATFPGLRRHMESHSLVKSYSCTVCGRGFSQKNNLKGHMRQHTKEKPFQCEMCAEAFTHKVSLKNHIWRQHGINMWMLNPSSSTGRPRKAGKKRKKGHTESTPKKRQRQKVK